MKYVYGPVHECLQFDSTHFVENTYTEIKSDTTKNTYDSLVRSSENVLLLLAKVGVWRMMDFKDRPNLNSYDRYLDTDTERWRDKVKYNIALYWSAEVTAKKENTIVSLSKVTSPDSAGTNTTHH